jgi:hypothetical protein
MKSFLIVLNGGPGSGDALKSTVILQRALGARLIVAHPKQRIPAGYVMASDLAPVIIAQASTDAEQSSIDARQAFDAVCGGDSSCTFRETQMVPDETLRKHSLFADLVVLARDEGEADGNLYQLKAALLANRAPTLWLPRAPIAAAPRTVVCVWNGQAPSARAIKAASPFLTRADRVIIIEYAGDEVNHNRLATYLDIHGIKDPVWRPYGNPGLTARGRARALMAEAKAASADLLVMGAYGEMAQSFLGFGRATEKVAQAATVPVLFHS